MMGCNVKLHLKSVVVSKAIVSILKVCFVTLMMPAPVTLAKWELNATRTPSMASSTVTAPQVTRAARVLRISTSVSLVRQSAGSSYNSPFLCLSVFLCMSLFLIIFPSYTHHSVLGIFISCLNFLSLTLFFDPSGPNPCEHGGSCKNTEGSFSCNCAPGYTGPRCEQDINECGSNPCQNDATCLDQIGDYTCICMPGTCRQTHTHCNQVHVDTVLAPCPHIHLVTVCACVFSHRL